LTIDHGHLVSTGARVTNVGGTFTVVASFPGSADYAAGSANTTFTINVVPA
jgi:hypothetical protein